MKKTIAFFCFLSAFANVNASWYWPFGNDEEDNDKMRLSTLMEPASLLIDDASDLAMDGKVTEAIAKYREALEELDKVEAEHPERAATPEFATLRNKRAYVNAAMDSIILAQARQNAKAVAVSDTTELEKKLAEEKAKKKEKPDASGETGKENGSVGEKKSRDEEKSDKAEPEEKPAEPEKPLAPPANKREQAMRDIAAGDWDAALLVIKEMLVEKPNGAAALNLRAVCEVKQGKFKEAEATLDQAIVSNPRNYHAYYNMANLMLQTKGAGGRDMARRYYETGRSVGGPVDRKLEEAVK